MQCTRRRPARPTATPRGTSSPVASDPRAAQACTEGNAAMQERLRRGETVVEGAGGDLGVEDGSVRGAGRLGRVTTRDGQTELVGGEGQVGAWRNEHDQWRVGGSGRVGVVSHESDDGEFQGGLGTASADAWVGEDGFSVGAQVNAAEETFDTGREPQRDRVDHRVRVGQSAGEGVALHGHWGDQDGDGDQEIGFGFDAGPVSFDIESEDYGSLASDLLGEGRDGHDRPTPEKEADENKRRRRQPAGPARSEPAPQPQNSRHNGSRESQISVLAARTGRSMDRLMTLGRDGDWIYHERAIAAATRQFQQEHDLPVTGELDPATIDALNR